MVIAYHSILCAHGFWLPNDPRGSGSDFVRHDPLLRFGAATPVTTRRSTAARPHDRELRRLAKTSLFLPPVRFTGLQAQAIGSGFAQAVRKCGFIVHACAILPDHVHLLTARHTYKVENVVGQLAAAATRMLKTRGLHPFQSHPAHDGSLPTPWARKPYHVFLNTTPDVIQRLRYVNQNPIKSGLRPQTWQFVSSFLAS